jgi:hypothetical protein
VRDPSERPYVYAVTKEGDVEIVTDNLRDAVEYVERMESGLAR